MEPSQELIIIINYIENTIKGQIIKHKKKNVFNKKHCIEVPKLKWKI
jgi:hypothetical protein